MTHEPVDEPDDVIPASIPVPRGLPPCRAALARYLSYRGQISADITRLEAGRDRLITELARADTAKAQAEEAFEAEAVTLADRVASGLDEVFSAFTGKPKPAPDSRLTRAALTKLEAELASKQALADRLQDRYLEHVHAALREKGADLAAEYARIIDELRNHICKMHSLDVACGGPPKRQIAASLPGFGGSTRPRQIMPSDHAIGVGVQSWKALGRGWAEDAKAPARKFLKFLQRDPEAVRFT